MIRLLDFLFSLIGLVLLFPFLIIISILIIIESKGSAFYLQERVGKNGKVFKLIKFRSMFTDSDKKGLITVGYRDNRITRVGFFIRKYKIDELPQLFNVLKGDMSVVGPRPEVRKYVLLYDDLQKKILKVKPGITDYASIYFINENELLEGHKNPELIYIEKILPEKIKYNMIYINDRSIYQYFKIILITLRKILK